MKEINYEVLKGASGVHAKAWVKGVQLEQEARNQILNLAQMPFVTPHIAVMPDAHAGKGSTVGTVIATRHAIIPAAVGVDLSCGVIAIKTSLMASELPDDLSMLRAAIEASIPHGRSDNGGVNDRGSWGNVPYELFEECLDEDALVKMLKDANILYGKHYLLRRSFERAMNQLGTLGTGNHFCEVCIDDQQYVWIMIHSGSRGIGNAIGSYFIDKAKEEMAKWFIHLPDKDLSYLPEGSQHFNDYFDAIKWAGTYATLNRSVMMHQALNALRRFMHNRNYTKTISTLQEAINAHHNYVAWEKHYGDNLMITRKGAVSAKEGELGIILGSMGARSYIVRGKGNRESFCSCSHGAGRVMSRTEARRTFSIEDHINSTLGVECRKDIDVIDETPKAYKNIDAVMAAQTDLVDIVATLKQIVCVKG